MLNVWIGNLGKYNEGELVGGWLKLPKSDKEIDEFLKNVVELNDEYEEYMINDYETDLPYKVYEYDIDSLVEHWLALLDSSSFGSSFRRSCISSRCFFNRRDINTFIPCIINGSRGGITRFGFNQSILTRVSG